MGLASWFRHSFAARHYPDTFSLRRRDLLSGIGRVLQQVSPDEHWIVAAHFPRSFEALTESLDQQSIRFRVGDRPLQSHSVRTALAPGEIVVTLAGMLHGNADAQPVQSLDRPVSVLLVERHPLLRHDVAVERFVECIPGQRRLAYYLALDDPLLRQMLSPQMLEVLRQFGLTEQHLVSSHLVSRAIKRWQRKIERRVRVEHSADSCEAWLERNVPGEAG